MAKTFFDDPDFQELLVAVICRDTEALRLCGHLLSARDFEPLATEEKDKGGAYNRWVVADLALGYWNKYREPVGRLVRSEVLAHARKLGITDRHTADLANYASKLAKMKLVGVSAVIERVQAYKQERVKAATIDELIELQATGKLTDEKWLELAHRAVSLVNNDNLKPVRYFEELEARIERRGAHAQHRHPFLMIDPLDALVKGIGRGHLGAVIGPYKRGKSLMLIWIAKAYVLQNLNVLYLTLEDPVKDVEDRFDAAVTALPLHRLASLPNKLRNRFYRFQRLLRARLHIYDGTDGGISVARIEQIIDRERDSGFFPDAVIIDYDDEIEPSADSAKKDRRFQFAQIYQDLRRLMSKRNLIGWTAAQTQRNTEDKRLVTASMVAEDISKVRKVTMAVTMGQGEWSEDSIYLYIAAHKFDRQHVGCEILSDKARMLIYDRERTQEQLRSMGEGEDSNDPT